MHKRLMRILGSILVIANLLSSNMGLLVNACTINPEPTETVAAVETEAEKKDEATDITETSDDQTATEEVVATPTTASESETKETEETEETTAESSDDTESTETLDTSATAEPTATTAPTSSPKPVETTSTTTTVQETTAESSTETAGTIETTVESSEAAEPSESSETTVPTPTTAPVSETLTRKILDSTGNSYTVTASYDADTGIPFDAELEVKEITSGKDYDDYYNKTVEVMGDQDVDYVRIFDISIVKDGVELEPTEGTTVNVKIQLDDTITKDLSVVHIADDKTAEVVETSSVKNEDGTEIVFEADGFSAYAIVAGPDAGDIQTGWRRITSLDAIPTYAAEIYIGHPDGFYMLGETYNVNDTRTGIKKSKPANTKHPAAGAQAYVFESTGTENQYKIHTKEDTPRYIKQSTNSLSFVTDPSQATAFKLGDHTSGNNCFYAQGSGTYCINQQGNAAGNGFAAYTGTGDTNARLTLWYYDYTSSGFDPYHLDGVTRGIMYYDSGVAGRGLMAKSSSSNILDALVMPVLTKENDHGDRLFVPNDTALTLWSFEWYEDDMYYIKAEINGVTYYLNVSSTGLSLSTTPQPLTIIPGTDKNAGKIAIEAGSGVVAYSGTTAGGFEASNDTNNTKQWLNLVDLSELTSDYMLPYSAKKISVADENITDDSKFIIYTRVWNNDEKKYEFYAVDHDGTLMRVFEEGDEIQWIDDRINTLLWDLTIYYEEDEAHTPAHENHFYELYNEYSEQYIHPGLATEKVLDDDIIGINMNGRRDGLYYTPFIAWDKVHYGYAGVRTTTETDPSTGDTVRRIISYPINDDCPVDESKDFYFAIVQESNYNEGLTEVSTIDHTLYGVTAKLIDFNPSKVAWANSEQSVFLGSSNGGAGKDPTKGLLSTNLGNDGYPTIMTGTHKDESLSGLYESSRLKEVNHLFLDSTYNTSGYFEFDSTQNFAELDTSTNNFKVYQELGTVDIAQRPSMSHGQFLPFNHITEGVYASQNTENLYDALQTLLPDNDPRKHEKLHAIPETAANYQFGLELETRFVQTPNGHDDWNHDIIYEFTGDDDFWLYVDGELVIDLGGVHSALYGSINYATGEVKIQEKGRTSAPQPGDIKTYNLRDIFYNNYKKRGHTDAEAQAYVDDLFEQNSSGQYIFKDYTTHTMKIFFMERGGGASNLHMKFNQSSVRPGTVILSKKLEGVDNTDSFYAEYPYQIFYQPRGEDNEPPKPYIQLTNTDQNVSVYYRGTNNPVKYASTYNVDGYDYSSVYFLKPGEACEIKIPDDAINYYVKECGVNPHIYDQVTFNEYQSTTASTPENADVNYTRRDYEIPGVAVKDRTSVEFENHIDEDALSTLTFEKKLYDERGVADGNEIYDDDTPFDFRLNFATEYQPVMSPANMYVYHVKTPDGYYCRWDSDLGRFVPIDGNKTTYSSLSAAEKKLASFNTSMNGAISQIPAFYKVEIRELLVGTKFQVLERYNEIPDGYSRASYIITERAGQTDRVETRDEDAIGTVYEGEEPYVVVNNLKGYGIRIYKEFTDQNYVSEREETYFAAYLDGTLIPGTIQRLKFTKDTLYWYFETLAEGKQLSDYHIREVKLKDPVVDSKTGYVTSYSTLSSVAEGESITLKGKLKGDTSSTTSSFDYDVEYHENVEITGNNIRVDRITNKRDGIVIKKEDMYDNPLKGAVFDLFDENASKIGSFTSDDKGFVTIAYLRKNVDYTLVEKKSPSGYSGLKEPLTVRMNSDGSINVSTTNTTDAKRFEFKEGPSDPSITVKNIRYNFSVSKEDKITKAPVKGVVFSLHRQRTVGGVTVVDFSPIPGYESLVTDDDGIVPRIDNTIPPGTYQLREISTPATHQGLNYYVLFTVTETGDIKLDDVHPEVQVLEEEVEEAGEKRVVYTLLIYNNPVTSDLSITKKVAGNFGSKRKNFDMTVHLSDASKNPYVGTFFMKKNSEAEQMVTLTLGDSGEVHISLAHDDTVIFRALNEHTEFSVQEDDLEGYKSEGYLDGTLKSSTGSVSGNIDDNHVVLFINTLEGIIPTGVDLPFEMSAVILSAMTAVVIFNTCWKMRRREDEED